MITMTEVFQKVIKSPTDKEHLYQLFFTEDYKPPRYILQHSIWKDATPEIIEGFYMDSKIVLWNIKTKEDVEKFISLF